MANWEGMRMGKEYTGDDDYDYRHDYSNRRTYSVPQGMMAPPPPKSQEETLREMLTAMQRERELERRVSAPKPAGPSPDERQAIVLYAIADRDFEDFLDMLNEPKSTPEAIRFLREMCSAKGQAQTDEKLNKIIISVLDRRASKSNEPVTFHDHLMQDDD